MAAILLVFGVFGVLFAAENRGASFPTLQTPHTKGFTEKRNGQFVAKSTHNIHLVELIC
jgi:hypothetical protein